jgi:hypothetical protein
VVFLVSGSFQANPLGAAAACFQTISPLAGFNCGNADGRTFTINTTPVDCAAPPTASSVPPRNGGYCVRATAGGNPAAFFSAY